MEQRHKAEAEELKTERSDVEKRQKLELELLDFRELQIDGRHSVEILRLQNKFTRLTAPHDIGRTLKLTMKDQHEVEVPRTIVVNLAKDAKNKKEGSEERAEKMPDLFKTILQDPSGLARGNKGSQEKHKIGAFKAA